jgi:peptidoglycan pentaglycine glycine transferase (the first glycine)
MDEKSYQLNFSSQSDKYLTEFSLEKEDPEWDAFVVSCPDPHQEQTSLWGDLQRLSGWTPFRLIVREGSKIVGGVQILERPIKHFGIIGYINRGPLLAMDKPGLKDRLIDTIKKLGKARKMIYLAVVLPYDARGFEPGLLREGFTVQPAMLPPSTPMMSTIVLDLTPDINRILMGMRASSRQNIRKAQKGGLTFREGFESDVAIFKQLLIVLCQRRGVRPNVPQGDFLDLLWKAFAPKGHLRLFLTEHAGEPVSALMLFTMGDWARVWRTGWSGCHENAYPNELIYWESIKWAKNSGYRFFDFVGFDTKYAKALTGGHPIPQAEICKMSFFKQGFGGKVMPLHPHYCLFLNPLLRFGFKTSGSYLLNSRILRRLVNAMDSRKSQD